MENHPRKKLEMEIHDFVSVALAAAVVAALL
jgi:hypothetical protein